MTKNNCVYCGKELDKKFSLTQDGKKVCYTGCEDLCSRCGEAKKLSTSCFSCKRNAYLISKTVKDLNPVKKQIEVN